MKDIFKIFISDEVKYLLPSVTVDTKLRVFQYKILSNILFRE